MEFSKNGSLKGRELLDQKKEELLNLFSSGRNFKVSINQESVETPLLCRVIIESKDRRLLTEAEKLIGSKINLSEARTTNSFLSRNGDSLILEVGGLKYRCDFCRACRNELCKLSGTRTLEIGHCRPYEKSKGEAYHKTNRYKRISRITKEF